eukprot:14919364-Alexandrium_andersonii.AAC.1
MAAQCYCRRHCGADGCCCDGESRTGWAFFPPALSRTSFCAAFALRLTTATRTSPELAGSSFRSTYRPSSRVIRAS